MRRLPPLAAAVAIALAALTAGADAARATAPVNLNGTWSIAVRNCSRAPFTFRGLKVRISRFSATTGEFEEYLANRDPKALNPGRKTGLEDSAGGVRIYLFGKQRGFTLFGLYDALAHGSGKTATITASTGCATITLSRV